MKWGNLVLCVAFAVASIPAVAQSNMPAVVNGNGLYERCKADAGTYYAGVCMGFTLGVAASISSFTDDIVCLPDNVTNGQIIEVVQNYLQRHPEIRQESSVILVGAALGVAWPCKK